MILPVLAFFLLLVAVLVAFGYWQRESSLVVLGYAMLFIIGSAGMIEGLEVQTGEVQVLDGNTTTISYTYEPYSTENWLGFRPFFWLAILGGFGVALTLIDFNDRFRRYRDEA